MSQLFSLLQISDDALLSGLEAVQKVSLKLIVRLIIDFAAVIVLVRGVYFHVHKRREHFFTYFIFNLVIFLICFLLNKVDLSMGAAFGLFAVFSMLRYRTEDISIRDMSYLFLVIAMGLINAVTKIKGASDEFEYLFLAIINVVIIVIAWALESPLLIRKESVQTITYDNIELIKSEHREKLLDDLKSRTGLPIHRITIGKIDFLKDAASIKIYYFEGWCTLGPCCPANKQLRNYPLHWGIHRVFFYKRFNIWAP